MISEVTGLRQAVRLVALLNLGYFFIEFVVAFKIGSVSLLADSVDFLEDSMVNFLIFHALNWSPSQRARLGTALAGILLIPAIAFLWTLVHKFTAPVVPKGIPLSITGIGALIINIFCAYQLALWHEHGGSLTKAAFLSARNDALANFAIIGAGLITMSLPTIWPDLIVGLGIALMNLDAARAVWNAARDERLMIAPQLES